MLASICLTPLLLASRLCVDFTKTTQLPWDELEQGPAPFTPMQRHPRTGPDCLIELGTGYLSALTRPLSQASLCKA